jgi:hypothetical protein
MSSTLRRNGTRQPQARNSASDSRLESSAKMPVASRRPAGTPIWGQLPESPRFPSGECSTAMRTAPPHSPPTPKPCTKRSVTSSTGAHTPIDE